jgi:hypothetical protein
MKKILLKKLTLENWRAQNTVIEFSGGVTEIRAKNGVGKSTLFNAWVWLLCGTDAQDRSNYDLYDTNYEQSKDTPTAMVQAELEVDGVELILKRCAKSQWTRPRGREEWVKALSDKYTFFVDNVEYQAKQYQEAVSQLFMGQDADMIKMMINPLQNLNLDWKTLRERFQHIIGAITEADYQGDYSLIKNDIAKHGFNNAKQGVMNLVTTFKNDLKKIKDDIAAKKRTLPDLSQCDEAQRQIEQKKARIAEIDAEITGIGDANKPYIEKRNAEEKAIQEKNGELIFAQGTHLRNEEAKVREAESQYRAMLAKQKEIEAYNNSLDAKARQLETDISLAKEDVKYLTETHKELHEQRDNVKARLFVYNDVCPTCGQVLPYDEAKVSQARMNFSDAKEREVAAIVEKGKAVRVRLDARTARLKELEAQRGTFVPKETIDLTPYIKAVNEAKASIVPFEQTEEYAKLTAELQELQSNRTEIPEARDTAELQNEKNKLLNEVQTLAEITAYRSIYAKISSDISSKEDEQNSTLQKLVQEEHKLAKFVEYEREHASIVSCRANKFLKIANVKMLTVNKSGEYADCCVITCDSVGNTMNRASVIRVGVDVANAFQRYFNVQAPLFVDDVDCIADELIPETEGQQIRLRFDPRCDFLTIVQ